MKVSGSSQMPSLHVENSVVLKAVHIKVVILGLEHVGLRVVGTVLGHHISHLGFGDIHISFPGSSGPFFLRVTLPILGFHQFFHFTCFQKCVFMLFSTEN